MGLRPEREAAKVLKRAVEEEMAFLPQIEDFLARALRSLDEAPADRIDVMAAAVGQGVADIYLLAENVLKRIAKACEGVPRGGEWHKDLLDAATLDLPDTRPPVISNATRAMLNVLREFRHVVRNVYGMRIEPGRARELAATVPGLVAAFRSDIAGFLRFLDAVAAAG